MQLAYLDNSDNFLGNTQTTLPQNTGFTNVEVSKNIIEGSTVLLITITPSQSNQFVYIDNLKVM